MRGDSRRLINLRRAAPGLDRVRWQPAPDPPPAHRSRYQYWGFISYARSDEHWAHSLHRQLEAYRIPRDVPPQLSVGILSMRRLRPVFRDDDELAASGDLGSRLREALDRSRFLILVASPAAAASRWVNAEVQHFVDAKRAEDILVLVVDGEPGAAPERDALPAALRRLAEEPLWVDGRGTTKPSRTTFLRLVAGMLNIGFDVLWQRDRRRRRRQVASWTATMLLLAAMVGGVVWQQQRIAEEGKPEHQVAAFRQFLVAEVLKVSRVNPDFKESDIVIDIVRTDDLNGDSLIDFFVSNRTSTFCGSGGCGMGVYLSEDRGRYRQVLDLFASTTPRTRDSGSGDYKEIVATQYAVDNLPIYSVFRWKGREYEMSHYEFCQSAWFEGCESLVITPIGQAAAEGLRIVADAVYRRRPDASAAPIEYSGPDPQGRALGALRGGDWYLVELWKGESGFVSRRYVRKG